MSMYSSELMEALSYDPYNDFELAALESMEEEAFNVYANMLEDDTTDALENVLESLDSTYDCADSDFDIYAALEAKMDWARKMKAGFMKFIRAAKAFFIKCAQGIKNLYFSLRKKMISRKLDKGTNKIKVSADAYNTILNLSVYLNAIKNSSSINGRFDSNTNTKDDALGWTNDRMQHLNDEGTHELSREDIKHALDVSSDIVKEGSKALQDLTKLNPENESQRDEIKHRKKVVSAYMKLAKKAIYACSSAIGKSNKEKQVTDNSSSEEKTEVENPARGNNKYTTKTTANVTPELKKEAKKAVEKIAEKKGIDPQDVKPAEVKKELKRSMIQNQIDDNEIPDDTLLLERDMAERRRTENEELIEDLINGGQRSSADKALATKLARGIKNKDFTESEARDAIVSGFTGSARTVMKKLLKKSLKRAHESALYGMLDFDNEYAFESSLYSYLYD